MDLTFLKWPLIIIIVGALIWLFTDGGLNWMESSLLAKPYGEDAQVDETTEARMSKLAGYLNRTFRSERADQLLIVCAERFPDGKNYYNNLYRRARIHERLGNTKSNPDDQLVHFNNALDFLYILIDDDAHTIDERVPPINALRRRATDIAERNSLGEAGDF
jgi:hypothetical protein